MNRLDHILEQRRRQVWALLAIAAVACGLLIADMTRISGERYRLKLLQNTVQGAANEMMALVMNAQLVASIGATGIIDVGLWQDGKDNTLLAKIGQALDADSVFIFNRSGIVNAAWNQNSTQSVGINISHDPYYREAMDNKNSVHATVHPGSGERGIYFSTPLRTSTGRPIGALVAHTGLKRLNALLARKSDLALLVSPQGIVFASTREDWVGRLAIPARPERIADLQKSSPIGSLIATTESMALPLPGADDIVALEKLRHAVARSDVHWSDPDGAWALILGEDLARSTDSAPSLWAGLGGGGAIFLLGAIALIVLRQKRAREEAAINSQAVAEQQESLARNKTRITEASLRFQQTASTRALADSYLQTTHDLLEVLQGAVYLVTPAEAPTGLQLLAGFGCSPDIPLTLKFGEGLLGQCAVEQKARVVTGIQPDYWTITSVLCTTVPTEIVLLPLLRQAQLLGVVELAPSRPFDAGTQIILDELTMLLSLNLEIHLRNEKTRQLLDETRWQTREMQEQSAEIERQRGTLAALIDAIPDPISCKDVGGLYFGCNAAFARSVNKTKEEIIGHCVADIYPPDDAARIRRLDAGQIASKQPVIDQERIALADGRSLLLETLRAPFFDGNGQLIGLLSIGRDLTAGKAALEGQSPPV